MPSAPLPIRYTPVTWLITPAAVDPTGLTTQICCPIACAGLYCKPMNQIGLVDPGVTQQRRRRRRRCRRRPEQPRLGAPVSQHQHRYRPRGSCCPAPATPSPEHRKSPSAQHQRSAHQRPKRGSTPTPTPPVLVTVRCVAAAGTDGEAVHRLNVRHSSIDDQIRLGARKHRPHLGITAGS